MTELSDQGTATSEQLATDAASQLTKANRYAFSLLAGTRNVLLDEMLFAGNEFFDRAVAETRIFNEFLAKLAEAHSCIRSAPGISWTLSAGIPSGS